MAHLPQETLPPERPQERVALAPDKQAWGTGNATCCPTSGTLRDAGEVLGVLIDGFN